MPTQMSGTAETAKTDAKGAKRKEIRLTEPEKGETRTRGRMREERAGMNRNKMEVITCTKSANKPTVAQLRQQLQQLNLPTYGRKVCNIG